jgi:hypothetical protein
VHESFEKVFGELSKKGNTKVKKIKIW